MKTLEERREQFNLMWGIAPKGSVKYRKGRQVWRYIKKQLKKGTSELSNCHDCGAKPGKPHTGECDVERCSVCGGQRLQCECKGHDRLFARWTGLWPGCVEATALGMDLNEFAKLSDIFFIKPTLKNSKEEK